MESKPFEQLNERDKAERISTVQITDMIFAIEGLDKCVAQERGDDDFNRKYEELREKYIDVIFEFKELIHDKFNPPPIITDR